MFFQMTTPVVWNKPDSTSDVPLWIIILAILAGLLLLALLIYVLYKVSMAINRYVIYTQLTHALIHTCC